MDRNNNQIGINNTQLMTLLVCLTWPTIINYGSSMVARIVSSDMWISGIIGVLTTVLFIFLVVNLGQKYPGKTIVEYSRSLLGFIPGKLLGLVLSIYLFVTGIIAVAMYIHHLTDYLLPETPFLVITVMHVLVVSYFVWLGLEVIARFSVISFVLALVFTMLVFLATLPEINFNRILPLFEAGLLNDSLGSIKVNSFIGHDLIVVAMLLPMIKEQKKAARSATLGVVVGGLIFIFYFIAELMVMGPQLVSLLRIASMDFVRSIQITQYLHRFESFMVGLWYWSILVQGGILIYCAHLAFRQTVGIKRQNIWLAALSGIIMVILTYLMAHNRVYFLNFREYSFHFFALPVQYGVPVLLLIISFFRRPAAAGK